MKAVIVWLGATYLMFLAATTSWGLDLFKAQQDCTDAIVDETKLANPDIDRVMRNQCAPMFKKAEITRRVLDQVTR